MIESLRYYARTNVAVVLAAAITTAVLTGALLVGDSMRGSLRDLTLDRLGGVDQALLSDGFFRQELADELLASAELSSMYDQLVPLLLLRGAAIAPDTDRRAGSIGIQGVSEGFAGLFPDTPLDLTRGTGQRFPSVVINRSLQKELGVEIGDPVLLSLARPSEIPREMLMGSTDPADVVQTLRLEVTAVVDDRGVGRLSVVPHQDLPQLAFVDLEVLQRALGQRRRVNALFASLADDRSEASLADTSALERAVVETVQLEDFGLELEASGGALVVTSREIVLRPNLEAALIEASSEIGAAPISVSTYLANRTTRAGSEAPAMPYSTITGLGGVGAFDGLELVGGEPAPALGPGQIYLNEWARDDLGVAVGDRLDIEYWEVGEREELLPRTETFELTGVVALAGLGADRSLTPDFPGVADARNMSDWDPTFPVDLDLIRDKDEQYWDDYGATPKMFITEADARRLWSSRFGTLSSVRLAAETAVEVESLGAGLRRAMAARLDLRESGLVVQAVKAQGLGASKGATDFGGLFIGFSLFLIVSAALLVLLFFRLGTESRAPEIGLRLATGYRTRSVRRTLMAEGGLLAAAGGLLGLLGSIGYAAAVLWALQTLWVGAIGTPFLELQVAPLSLAMGFVIGFVLALLAIWRAVRRMADLPVPALLRGQVATDLGEAAASKRSRRVALGAALVALLLFGLSWVTPSSQAAPLFMALGAALVVLGLALVSLWLQRAARQSDRSLESMVQMASANTSLHPGRSLLSAGLVASACFVIVAVGAYGHRFGDEVRERDSGAGGFSLIAESEVPVYSDLNTADGRFELGFDDDESELLAGGHIVPMRVLPGDDMSCLNLYQPTTPRLLGAPPDLIERGGFHFTQLAERPDNPWTLLEQRLEPEDGVTVVPVFGDFNSVMWILKSGLGQDVEVENERGEKILLRIRGLLRRSLFQRELILSEANLLEHFPSRAGYSYFLIDMPEESEDRAAAVLEKNLGGFGFDAVYSTQRLESFQAVENTYLGTFRILGGLGLLLGTVGLAVILLRNVLERRSEMATLRAVGFRRRRLARLVFLENGVVLTAGIVIGSIAALVAIAPHLRGGHALVPWGALSLTLLAVLVVGLSAGLVAARQVLHMPLLESLRAE